MSLPLEDPKFTAEKRFMQAHYSYRDFYSATTSPVPTPYLFGAVARAISRFNWPAAGDWALARSCFTRSVMVQCTEDCYIMLTCLNPEYFMRLAQGFTAAQIVNDLGVPLTINEVPTFIPKNAMITFNPTYGYAITFYQSTASGTLRIWAEGNVEGNE